MKNNSFNKGVVNNEEGGAKIQRLVGLDLMRVLLALLIFLFHSRMHFDCDYFVRDILINVFYTIYGYKIAISPVIHCFERFRIIFWIDELQKDL